MNVYGRAATAEEVTLKGLAPAGTARSEFRPGLDLAAAASWPVCVLVLFQPGLGAAISDRSSRIGQSGR